MNEILDDSNGRKEDYILNSHPSKDIIGTKGTDLRDRKIVLCVTGSVAAVRCSDIARGLMRYGAEVFVVMSEMAQKIIHPYLMEWATGNPVVTELTGEIEHVALVGQHPRAADLVLVAPATANTISKISCGIDDTSVTSVVSTAFGSGVPILIVPAMHESMYNHPILVKNVDKLKALGVEFIYPRFEEGKAKIAETEEIIGVVLRKLTKERDFTGRNVLITAGPTLEYVDPIRVITNKSSGKMGVALVREALNRGAYVTLIYGPGTTLPPYNAQVRRVETTQEMYDTVVSELKSKQYDLVIAAAAPADWIPEKPFDSKIPTRDVSELSVKFKLTEKIIDTVKKVSQATFLVPFKAEYRLSNDELIARGYRRLVEAEADLIVVNDVGKKGAGFDVETNEVFIIDKKKKVIHIPLTTKREIAKRVFDAITEKIRK
jgi:phosphopantothenoylcysteine decarboxylase/phosphopantothenate--cysteine ligase